MKVSDLSGTDLDYWVAKASGLECEIRDGHVYVPQENGQSILWRPSVDWSLAGPIISREWLSLSWRGDDHTKPGGPHCSIRRGAKSFYFGHTQLEAMMRAYVGFKLGDEVHHVTPQAATADRR